VRARIRSPRLASALDVAPHLDIVRAPMRKLLKILGAFLAVLVVAVGGFVAYVQASWPPSFPETPTPDIHASADPEVIARGEYLFHAVAHCSTCHSSSMDEVATLSAENLLVPKGGFEWQMGPIGTLRSANLTSDPETGIGSRTDGQLARAIRYAVRHDDRAALFMIGAGPMSDEDLTALVSYMRTIPPVKNQVAAHEVSLMGKLLFSGPMRFLAGAKPELKAPPYVPAGGASAERGRYLAEGPAACMGCHSEWNFETWTPVEGLFAGDREPHPDMTDPTMEFSPPNLTPDPKTGHIAAWTEDQFVERMHAGRAYAGSPMPWEALKLVTEDDLRSIYRHLRQVPAIERMTGPVRRPVGWKPEG
jgi:mono/diheme cytochrome c family protein